MEEFDWDADCGHGELGMLVVKEELLAEFCERGGKIRVSDFHAKRQREISRDLGTRSF